MLLFLCSQDHTTLHTTAHLGTRLQYWYLLRSLFSSFFFIPSTSAFGFSVIRRSLIKYYNLSRHQSQITRILASIILACVIFVRRCLHLFCRYFGQYDKCSSIAASACTAHRKSSELGGLSSPYTLHLCVITAQAHSFPQLCRGMRTLRCLHVQVATALHAQG